MRRYSHFIRYETVVAQQRISFSNENSGLDKKQFYLERTDSFLCKEMFLSRTENTGTGKVLLWLASTERGISPPDFLGKKASLRVEIYKEECITKYLVPSINKYHQDEE